MGFGSIGTASEPAGGGGGGTGTVESIVEGKGIVVDATDPANPIVAQASANYRLNVRLLADSNHALTGLAAIDSVVPVAGDRVCLVGQTAPAENGVWVAAAGAWTRATDFDASADMIAGLLVSVTEGTVYAATLWEFATTGAIVVGTTALSFALIGPTFGPDTRVSLPNDAGVDVQALRLLTELVDDTAGAEVSQLTIFTIQGGVAVSAAVLSRPSFQIPDALLFLQDTNTGVVRNGADNFGLMVGGVQVAVISAIGITFNAGAGAYLAWGAAAGYVHYNSGNGHVTVSPADGQGNTQLGLGSGAALATNATHGFASIQSCAGTPTGAPSSGTGFVPLVVDTTNNKLYAYYGGAWHSLSP